jgi:hypothetical protein
MEAAQRECSLRNSRTGRMALPCLLLPTLSQGAGVALETSASGGAAAEDLKFMVSLPLLVVKVLLVFPEFHARARHCL